MYGKSFTYGGQSSEDYGLFISSFNVDDEIPLGLSRNILKGETNRFRPVSNHMGTEYNDVLVFDVSFVKNPCTNGLSSFTESEIDNIAAWLTSPDYPSLFHMYGGKDDYLQYDYFGIFSDIQAFAVGDSIMGLTCTFTTNSPYAYTSLITKEFVCSGETEIKINVNTSERKREIYPIIDIFPANTDTLGRVSITIKNTTDNNRVLSLSVLKEPLTIDCAKSKICDEVGLLSFEDLGISDIGCIYWPRLYHGENVLTITGDARIVFKYREPRKVGAY